VAWHERRTSFSQLQRRLSAGHGVLRLARQHPAHYVVFDLLRDAEGQVLLNAPLARRRARLVALLTDAPTQLALTPKAADLDHVLEWLPGWLDAGIEGVVAKRVDGAYLPGGAAGRNTAPAPPPKRSSAASPAPCPSRARCCWAATTAPGGCVTSGTPPLTPAQQRDLAPLLHPPLARHSGGAGAHPWPHPLPAGWPGRLHPAEPLRYLQADPTVVAEVQPDTAVEHGRWCHPVRFLRVRADLSVHDVPTLVPDPATTDNTPIRGHPDPGGRPADSRPRPRARAREAARRAPPPSGRLEPHESAGTGPCGEHRDRTGARGDAPRDCYPQGFTLST
jgi:hypothetical protein